MTTRSTEVNDEARRVDAQRLRDAGLRVTAPRLAVLAAVRAGNHLAADDVTAAARERIGSISTQATYDVLAALVRVGLVRRIEPAGSPARFETRVADNHHHIICRRCGVAVDVDCAMSQAPCLEPPGAAGFVIDEAEVIFWGVCPDCRRSRR
ncbi:MAG TPA: Fur family transcriptional regulator [Solirubrobacteraceae bacterium]|jgi:Fur family ferric uptake transcriptional regulator|nr:Fur family transcriptional regulator [Solirubrobacteraceae bacterium]